MIKQRSRLHFFVQVITIDELLNMMSVFIEIGEGKGHKVIYDYFTVLILHFLNWSQHFAKNYDCDMYVRKENIPNLRFSLFTSSFPGGSGDSNGRDVQDRG